MDTYSKKFYSIYLISPRRNLPRQADLLLQGVKLQLIYLTDHLAENFIPGKAVKVQHHKMDHQVVQAAGGDAEKGELLIVHRRDGLAEDAGFGLKKF